MICLLSATLLSGLSLVALAQEPSPFEISVIPLGDHAVSGQPFTYTVTITNTSQKALGSVFVNVDVPEGTKFLRTHHLSQNWYGGSPDADPNIQVKEITLFSFEPVSPSEVFSFEMIVEVLPETREVVAIETFNSTTFKGNVLAAGDSIITQVQTPTPTPTPTPTSTPLPTSTPSPATTTAAQRAADSVSTPTPTISINSTETVASTSIEANPSLFITIIAGVGLLLILVLIGVMWLLKRR